MQDCLSILESEYTYHIYSRANGKDLLFRSDHNYRYFLRKYKERIFPLVDTYCYCLMPNHFHFLVRVKDLQVLDGIYNERNKENPNKKDLAELSSKEKDEFFKKYLSQQFSHLLNGYTQAYNKMYKRQGGLFNRPFKRKQITSDRYFYNLVKYIHFNPVEAGLCLEPMRWNYSSYAEIISGETDLVNDKAIRNWFNDTQSFTDFHHN